jgi:hypothetical protein
MVTKELRSDWEGQGRAYHAGMNGRLVCGARAVVRLSAALLPSPIST